MNKTVTINISGIIFNIDEEAFQKLSQYLETIKGYFSTSEGRDEIMADIEARIAEMFQEKISDKNQVVSMANVKEVIAIMGEPEDYLPDDDEAFTDEHSSNYTPPKNKATNKRLYRDGDSRVIGGVCSGIGHYFDVDPIIFRILFVISFLGFGTGILFYIILWIIIPEAKTTAEKLQMKGERINIDNIKKTVEEEAENLKHRFHEFKDKASPAAKNGANKARNFFDSLIAFIVSLFTLFFKFFGKIIGIIFLVGGSIGLISLLLSLFTTTKLATAISSDGVNAYGLTDLSNIFFSSGLDTFVGVLGAFLVAGIPLFFIAIAGAKLLFSQRVKTKMLALVGFVLWGIGFICVSYAGISTATDFSFRGNDEKVVILETNNINTLYLKVDHTNLPFSKYAHQKRRHRNNGDYFEIDGEQVYIAGPTFDIQASEDSTYKLVITKYARGTSSKEAFTRASSIKYAFAIEDSTLLLDPLYYFDVEDKWRKQDIEITLLVPNGKSVYIDDSMENIIYDIDNVTDTYDGAMLNLKWTMLTPGLTCIDCFEGWEGRGNSKGLKP